jgi:hypothetical protein
MLDFRWFHLNIEHCVSVCWLLIDRLTDRSGTLVPAVAFGKGSTPGKSRRLSVERGETTNKHECTQIKTKKK